MKILNTQNSSAWSVENWIGDMRFTDLRIYRFCLRQFKDLKIQRFKLTRQPN